MSYSVKLDSFEGPLDLLLHLIAKSKINIEDISITEITKQYLDYLNKMKLFDMEIASEFLVMASKLLYIKSSLLVPKTKSEEDLDEPDPQQQLIERLKEYKLFKEVSEIFNDYYNKFSGICSKPPENYEVRSDMLIANTTDELLEVFTRLLVRADIISNKQPPIHKVNREVVTVDSKIAQITSILNHSNKISFLSLFNNTYSREDMVVTFLAILELVKREVIYLKQIKHFDDITIKKKVS